MLWIKFFIFVILSVHLVELFHYSFIHLLLIHSRVYRLAINSSHSYFESHLLAEKAKNTEHKVKEESAFFFFLELFRLLTS